MKKICVLLLLIVMVYPVSSQTDEKALVAVLDLDANGIDESVVLALSDRLRTELLNTGRFDVMERKRMDIILQEQGFQQSGACNSTECAIEVGQLLGVDRMIAGSVGKVGSIYTLSVQMIDMETGRILLSRTEDCDCPIENVLTQSVQNIANKMANPTQNANKGPEIKGPKKDFPWLWVGLGAIAIGSGIALSQSGDDDGGSSKTTTSTGSIHIQGEW